jgi:glycosyltransferase involved in cell wall biosynthesis
VTSATLLCKGVGPLTKLLRTTFGIGSGIICSNLGNHESTVFCCMNVLHVSPSFYPSKAYGGTIRSGYGLCRGLAQLGCDVRVLTTNTDGLGRTLGVANDREVQVDGLRVRYCHKQLRHSVSPALLGALPSYVQWANVVHLTAVYSFPTFPTLFFCRLFNKPVVWSPRGALQRWEGSSRVVHKWFWESICQKLAPNNLVLHVTSQAEAEQSLKRFPRLRAMVIRNGVDVPQNLTRSASNGKLRLLYLGRLHPIKGIESLLEACGMLGGLFPDWLLHIAGSGPQSYVDFLKSRVQEFGLSKRVEFVGEVFEEKKDALFAQSDVALVPSHIENFGIVVAEALAHAVPVIASKGTPWIGLETNRCGLWVDNDPESLATAIQKIRTLPLQEMGQRGREWMEKNFSWELVSAEMLAVYRECIRGQTN